MQKKYTNDQITAGNSPGITPSRRVTTWTGPFPEPDGVSLDFVSSAGSRD